MAGMERRKKVLLGVALGVLAFTCLGLAGAGVLFVFVPPALVRAAERAEGSACAARLRAAYQGLVIYGGPAPSKTTYGAPPADSGGRALRAFAELRDAYHAAYRERDQERFPVEGFSGDGSQPLAACDNALLQHGRDLTHVLYADASVRELSLRALKAEGAVPAEAERLLLGPDSPLADLRKLRRD